MKNNKLNNSLSPNEYRTLVSKCLLCHDAICDKACPYKLKPSKFLRSLYFDNAIGAGKYINKSKCLKCKGFCQSKCINRCNKVDILELIKNYDKEYINAEKVDISIKFLNKKCENPFFLASSAVSTDYDMCRKALKLGWGGIVMKTVSLHDINETSPRFTTNKNDNTFISFQNLEQLSEKTLEENLGIIKKLKKEFPKKIIVGSIMGNSEAEWTKLAKIFSKSGCDIIECNFSCPQMTYANMGSAISANTKLAVSFTKAVLKGTSLPIIVKLSPNFGPLSPLAIAVKKAGANAISTINTISSISSIDLETMCPNPNIDGKSAPSGLSGKAVKPIALRFIAELAKCKELKNIQISGIGGIETWRDALEFITLGCRNVQVCTAVMQYGYRIIDDLIVGLKTFLKTHNCKSLEQLVGKAVKNVLTPEKLNRSTIVYPSFNLNKCIKCGRCYLSCYDGGVQAIEFNNGKLIYNAKKCIGCHLCRQVCPVNAIGTTKRINKIKK